MGIKIDTSLNIKFLKVPLFGSPDFVPRWIDSKLSKLTATLDVITKLPNPHVAFHLLGKAAGVCTVMFWMRTMPASMVSSLFSNFDQQQRATLEMLLGSKMSEEQWEQAQLPLRLGGCGIRGAVAGADAAYVMSRAMTRTSCKGLDNNFVDEGDVEEQVFCGLGEAVRHVNDKLPSEKQIGDDIECTLEDVDKKWLVLNTWVEEETAKRMLDRARGSECDAARLLAVRAPGSAAFLDGAPSREGGTMLNGE